MPEKWWDYVLDSEEGILNPGCQKGHMGPRTKSATIGLVAWDPPSRIPK